METVCRNGIPDNSLGLDKDMMGLEKSMNGAKFLDLRRLFLEVKRAHTDEFTCVFLEKKCELIYN